MLKRKLSRVLLFVLLVLPAVGTVRSWAQEVITFGPRETKINGAIKYTVIGWYKASFKDFKGIITLDERAQRVRSVYLEIDAKSITSDHPWCDRFARSRRLLCAARYPKIIFKSDRIMEIENGYKVTGVLEMHGVKKRMTFLFIGRMIIDQKTKRKSLDIEGNWSINRKDFNIVWNKFLDHGGILVGDIFTVSWGIKVPLPLERF